MLRIIYFQVVISRGKNCPLIYTLSEAWSEVNWADLMAAQGAFGADLYDRSTRKIVGTMLWTEYRPVIKISPKGAQGIHEIRPIHSARSLGQSIPYFLVSHSHCFGQLLDSFTGICASYRIRFSINTRRG